MCLLARFKKDLSSSSSDKRISPVSTAVYLPPLFPSTSRLIPTLCCTAQSWPALSPATNVYSCFLNPSFFCTVSHSHILFSVLLPLHFWLALLPLNLHPSAPPLFYPSFLSFCLSPSLSLLTPFSLPAFALMCNRVTYLAVPLLSLLIRNYCPDPLPHALTCYFFNGSCMCAALH